MSGEVSVIIPVCDAARTIERALDSVFAQTFTNFEIIVVDDGSSDRTVELVSQFNDDRLRLICHSQNRGAAAARNAGIEAAKGRWIAFLDADDAWFPEKLALQVELLERVEAGQGACSTGFILHKEGRERTVTLDMMPESFRSNIFFGCTFSPGTTLMIDRAIFDKIGGFDEEFRRLEDWDWLLRFSEHYNMQFLPQPLAHIYLLAQSAPGSVRKNDLTFDAIRRIDLKHGSHYESWRRRMQLKSSLLIELAAAMHHRRRPLIAAAYVAAALAIYPLRNLAFFRTLLRSAVEHVGLHIPRD